MTFTMAVCGLMSTSCLAAGDDTTAVSQGVSGSGIPYLSDDQAQPKDVADAIRARRGGHLLNLDRMLLQSPNYAKGWNTMLGAVRTQLALAPRLRELAIMTVAVLNKADYEWTQHTPEFLAAGGTEAQLAALRNVAAASRNSSLFTETERATLDLTREMTRNVAVRKATMKRIRAALPDQQVVELVGTISAYNMVSRFLVATGVGPESTAKGQ
jgi:alkylhydroperoxidase family enzyme